MEEKCTTPPLREPPPLRLASIPGLIWAFSESDIATFVAPNTAFGILGALAGSSLATAVLPTSLQVLVRLPLVIAFNWYSVLVFDLANQRSPASIQEDSINKPWRPIPSGKVAASTVSRALLVLIPITWFFNYLLGVWNEGLMVQLLTWAYNDLGGGDSLARDPIIAVAYAFFNLASLKIALGPQAIVTYEGYVWIAVISGVVLTTMQVQDLKDQEGDKARGRRTVPIVFGDKFSRITIGIFVCAWSIFSIWFWSLGVLTCVITGGAGLVVVGRAMLLTTVKADSLTWKLWCLWTVSLFVLPLLATFDVWWL